MITRHTAKLTRNESEELVHPILVAGENHNQIAAAALHDLSHQKKVHHV